jgi:hypothetical protein
MVVNVYIYSYSISGSTYTKAEEELASYYEGLGYKVIRGQYPTGLGGVTLPTSLSLLPKIVSAAVKLGRSIAPTVSQGLRQRSINQIIGDKDCTHGFIHIQSIPIVRDESNGVSRGISTDSLLLSLVRATEIIQENTEPFRVVLKGVGDGHKGDKTYINGLRCDKSTVRSLARIAKVYRQFSDKNNHKDLHFTFEERKILGPKLTWYLSQEDK